MSDKELLIKELIVKDFNEILVNEFCTDWKEKRLYIELLVRATHFDYLLNYIQEKDKEIDRLNNIIKEIRELCLMFARGRLERTNYDDILEVIDKVGVDKE